MKRFKEEAVISWIIAVAFLCMGVSTGDVVISIIVAIGLCLLGFHLQKKPKKPKFPMNPKTRNKSIKPTNNKPFVPMNKPFTPMNKPFTPTNKPFVPTSEPFTPMNKPFIETSVPNQDSKPKVSIITNPENKTIEVDSIFEIYSDDITKFYEAFGYALKKMNYKTESLQEELGEIDVSLKLNTNTDTDKFVLLSRKKNLLEIDVANTSKKMELLKSAQEYVDNKFRAGEISVDEYRGFDKEVEGTRITKKESMIKPVIHKDVILSDSSIEDCAIPKAESEIVIESVEVKLDSSTENLETTGIESEIVVEPVVSSIETVSGFEYEEIRVAGVTFKTGRKSRQAMLRKIKNEEDEYADYLEFGIEEHEYEGKPAFAVLVNDEQIGNLPANMVQWFIDNSERVVAIDGIEIVGGGENLDGEKLNYGARITLKLRKT